MSSKHHTYFLMLLFLIGCSNSATIENQAGSTGASSSLVASDDVPREEIDPNLAFWQLSGDEEADPARLMSAQKSGDIRFVRNDESTLNRLIVFNPHALTDDVLQQNLDVRDEVYGTPLHAAVRGKHVPTLDRLIEVGIDATASVNVRSQAAAVTAFQLACEQLDENVTTTDVSIVESLIQDSAINAKHPTSGRTPIMVFLYNLTSAKTDIFHKSSAYRLLEILCANYDKEITDETGLTAFDYFQEVSLVHSLFDFEVLFTKIMPQSARPRVAGAAWRELVSKFDSTWGENVDAQTAKLVDAGPPLVITFRGKKFWSSKGKEQAFTGPPADFRCSPNNWHNYVYLEFKGDTIASRKCDSKAQKIDFLIEACESLGMLRSLASGNLTPYRKSQSDVREYVRITEQRQRALASLFGRIVSNVPKSSSGTGAHVSFSVHGSKTNWSLGHGDFRIEVRGPDTVSISKFDSNTFYIAPVADTSINGDYTYKMRFKPITGKDEDWIDVEDAFEITKGARLEYDVTYNIYDETTTID